MLIKWTLPRSLYTYGLSMPQTKGLSDHGTAYKTPSAHIYPTSAFDNFCDLINWNRVWQTSPLAFSYNYVRHFPSVQQHERHQGETVQKWACVFPICEIHCIEKIKKYKYTNLLERDQRSSVKQSERMPLSVAIQNTYTHFGCDWTTCWITKFVWSILNP